MHFRDYKLQRNANKFHCSENSYAN